jgi:23S rRNA pseudouridine1911/1915/1917 synthase
VNREKDTPDSKGLNEAHDDTDLELEGSESVTATPGTTWRWTVGPDSASVRADVAIPRAIEEGLGEWTGEQVPCSRSRLQKLMEDGQVILSGESPGVALRARDKLVAGAQVLVRFPSPRPLGLIPEDRPLDILFEDEHLIVVNKPAGLTVHPSETQRDGTLVHALLHHVRDLSGIGGELRPGIVHRIDKDTSGALVITKTDQAHQALAAVFAQHAIERSYWALCYGSPMSGSGTIESLIGRNPNDRKKMSMEVREGRRAVTHWKRLEEYGVPRAKPFASWIEATLETGRTHQVRVHLTGLGHSLLGDPTYGVPSDRHPKWLALPGDVREAVRGLRGQALHARALGFDHPVTGKRMRFEAEPPTEFRAAMGALAGYR